MSNLSAAIDRFNHAMARVERALAHLPDGGNNHAASAEIARLKSQRERLMAELETLRSQREADAALRSEIGGRLDQAIGELRRVLAR